MARPVVLCVDDERIVLDGIKEQLRRHSAGKFSVETAESGEEALEMFEDMHEEGLEVPVVISDHIMPRMKGSELLSRVHRLNGDVLTILLTGQADADAVGHAVNESALYRYIAKPWSEDDLVLTVREALRRHAQEKRIEQQKAQLQALNEKLRGALTEVESYKAKLEAENLYLKEELQSVAGFSDIVGGSDRLVEVLGQVQQVAQSEATVLVTGESGTGKELFAQAIHDRSPRRSGPIVKLNCAALPDQLVESELFGHEKGAFTGATIQRRGRFELADGGTLFMDEVGEMPLVLQAKLLRALQEGEFERVGGSSTQRVDVRVVAATNRDLAQEVEAGRFREDLYYRLNVFPVEVPPLRERKDDIALLAKHFARRFAQKMGKPIDSISEGMLAQLVAHDWPGNVRELQNVIERSVILCQGGRLELPPLTTRKRGRGSAASTSMGPSAPRTMREMEQSLIREALEACKGVIGGKGGAARRLDMPASTLRERIQRYGL